MTERKGMDAWKLADELFDQWLDLEDAGRDAWLAAQDLDLAVQERLQRLVDAHLRPSTLLSTPASDLSGVRLGAWTLESELGRGGMAVVYRASRSDGIARQEAALKVLTVGALGATGRDRFRREAEILARLNHPNITPLIDSGIEPDGTCWLAMPLIEGQRIDAWGDSHHLDARGVTRLFLQVCDAVALAHRNLVIHRDLKPSNVLVEADGHVRLLDFGIGQFTDVETERTQTMWRALTPGYAAPEQLHGGPPTTAIDIYGLGALLHRLLTGRTPQSSDDRSTTTRPSLLVRTASDAYHRHYVPLKNDLDRVLLKALAEEPERRYHSAEAFADDLRRWLDGRPVMARQPGMAYRARKFISRNKVGVAAAMLVAASLAAGLGTTLWQAREARLEAARALAARNFMVQLFEASDPDVAQGRQVTARELLDQGAHQIRTAFPDTPRLRAEMLLLLGELYGAIGELDEAAPLVREGLDLAGSQEDGDLVSQARIVLGQIHLDEQRAAEALAEFDAAERVLESIGRVPGIRHGKMMHAAAMAMSGLGQGQASVVRAQAVLDRARARRAPDDVLAHYLLAASAAFSNVEQFEPADRLLHEFLALSSGDSAPLTDRMLVHGMLSDSALVRGELDEGLRQIEQARLLADRIHVPMHSTRAALLVKSGLVLLNLGRLDEAEAFMRESITIQKTLHPEGRTQMLAGTYNNLALALELAERDTEAEPYMVGAMEMAAELFGREDVRYAIATTNVGSLYRRLGRLAEADALLDTSLELRRRLLGDAHPQVGHTLVQFALLRLDQDRPADALAFADDALALYSRAENHDPRRVGVAQVQRALAMERSGRVREAGEILERAIAEARAAGVDNGAQWVRLLAARADFAAAHRPAGAAAAIAEAVDGYTRTFGANHPGTRRYAALRQGQAMAAP